MHWSMLFIREYLVNVLIQYWEVHQWEHMFMLNCHYRWLTAVLKRIIYSLKVSKVMMAKDMEQNKEEFQQVT